jgi:hypothetical protein
MQTLTCTRDIGHALPERPADAAAVDAVLTASRLQIAVATRSLGAAAEETTIPRAGEVPDSQWPSPGPAGEAGGARPRRPARSAANAKESP